MNPAGASALLAAAVVGGAVLLWAARRSRWLARRAILPAAVIGLAVVLGAGAGGGLLLVFFLTSTSFLTRFRASDKPDDGREHATTTPGRTARQVWANGGVAAACAALSVLPAAGGVGVGVAGALAAAMADSWATEIGTALRGRTLLVTSLREVQPGTSGGVSVAGTLGGLGAALLAGALVAVAPELWTVPWGSGSGSSGSPFACEPVPLVGVVALAGTMGMLVDSVLGATAEDRVAGIDNETVNFLATLIGALVAILVSGACIQGAAGP